MDKNLPSPPKKRPGVGRLISSTDARKLQAKLLKQLIAGDIDESVFRAATYGISQFLNCLKTEADLKPDTSNAAVTEIRFFVSEETEKQIEEMNSNIMEAPEAEE